MSAADLPDRSTISSEQRHSASGGLHLLSEQELVQLFALSHDETATAFRRLQKTLAAMAPTSRRKFCPRWSSNQLWRWHLRTVSGARCF